MEANRISWLYDLARMQVGHEQEISSELSARGGFLAALAGLIIVALAEFWRFHGSSWLVYLACALLILALVLLVVASVGFVYERPADAKEWEEWATTEEKNGKQSADVDVELLRSLYDDYAVCARDAIIANDAKGALYNWTSRIIVSAMLCLAFALLLTRF
jgi:hypothetical protein